MEASCTSEKPMTPTRPSEPKKNKISEVTRRDIVDVLLLDSTTPFFGRLDLVSFLKRIWPLQQMSSEDYRFKTADGDIWQHMVNNSDWEFSELLYRRLGITDISDELFARFLETCLHPLVVSEPERISKLLSLFNEALRNDGFAMRASGKISGRLVYKVATVATGIDTLGQAYEVVLSFAGENRDYVERVAEILRANEVSLFYDDYEEASLWGKNLVEHLQKVYSGSARYCVMFISKHYAEKVWPTHERRSAFEKAIESKEEYILPARFDDTEIPGLHRTTAYVDLRKKTPRQLATLILSKLGRPQFEHEIPSQDDFPLSDEDIPF
jgi:AbiJ-like protein/TIR domain-containing protein